jgi:hypothetical protein
MMGISIAFVISLLLLFLLGVWRKATVTARELPSHGDLLVDSDHFPPESCPAEYVSKIFSRDDWEFVAAMKSPALERFFRAERKSLALLWVQQTSADIRKIMRHHAELSRSSEDLDFVTEMRLFSRYAELRIICGLLVLSIELAGPLWLRGLALHASKLSQRIEQAQEAFNEATEEARGVQSSGSL